MDAAPQASRRPLGRLAHSHLHGCQLGQPPGGSPEHGHQRARVRSVRLQAPPLRTLHPRAWRDSEREYQLPPGLLRLAGEARSLCLHVPGHLEVPAAGAAAAPPPVPVQRRTAAVPLAGNHALVARGARSPRRRHLPPPRHPRVHHPCPNQARPSHLEARPPSRWGRQQWDLRQWQWGQRAWGRRRRRRGGQRWCRCLVGRGRRGPCLGRLHARGHAHRVALAQAGAARPRPPAGATQGQPPQGGACPQRPQQQDRAGRPRPRRAIATRTAGPRQEGSRSRRRPSQLCRRRSSSSIRSGGGC
mmetsp:Transcript_11308/g.25713  ORF Transcript_11308/g.25713 Transcript_11308/m.25713 type:complete len:302 (+) Transcript_11308:2882-3787(+)